MAIGDQAQTAGYPVVPDSGPEGKVRYGAREINRSRDFLAALKALVPSNKPAYRAAAGVSSGTSDPTGGQDGDIYFKIVL